MTKSVDALFRAWGIGFDADGSLIRLPEGESFPVSTLVQATFVWRRGKTGLFIGEQQHVRIKLEFATDRHHHVEVKRRGRDAVSEAQILCDALLEMANAAREPAALSA